MLRQLLPRSLNAANVFRKFGKTIGGSVIGSLLVIVSPAMAQQGQPKHAARAVVELFTSQGCAACPPADALMCDYAFDSGIVVLTMPVTCWDYLGWRDTLANEKFTKRQRTYAKMRGERRIYTPQAVINGDAHLLGSDVVAMRKALTPITPAAAIASTPALPLAIDIIPEGEGFRVNITPSMASSPENASIILAPFYRAQTVAIGSGENKGSTLSYMNVVRDLVPLGTMPTTAAPNTPVTLSLQNIEAMPDNTDGFAILVQSGSTATPGRMLGAATFVSARAQSLPIN